MRPGPRIRVPRRRRCRTATRLPTRLRTRKPRLGVAGAVEVHLPDQEDRETLNQIVFSELAKGTFTEPSRLYLNKLIQELKDRGCDGAALACMELPMLVDPADCPLPTLDPTTLLAKAAIKEAVEV